MKLSIKIWLCSIAVMAVAFGIGGYFFVNDVFEASMEREIKQAMDESSILRFAFETAALNAPSKYGMLSDSAVEKIGANLEKSGQDTLRRLRLSDEEGQVLYAGGEFGADADLLLRVGEDNRAYRVIELEGRYFVQTGIMVPALDRLLYLETLRDVTEVYQERARGFSVYRSLMLLILVISSVFLFFISAGLRSLFGF